MITSPDSGGSKGYGPEGGGVKGLVKKPPQCLGAFSKRIAGYDLRSCWGRLSAPPPRGGYTGADAGPPLGGGQLGKIVKI